MFNYDILPFHMRDGARLYIDYGIPPGDFMMAVLCNDLKGAFGRADQTNFNCMGDWARWLYNECPSEAQGSEEKVAAWIKKCGLNGPAVPEGYKATDEPTIEGEIEK